MVQCQDLSAPVQQPPTPQGSTNIRDIMAVRDALRQRKEMKKVRAAANVALASDTAIAEPPPTNEPAVLLACTINNLPQTVALYEKNKRVDVTSDGATKTRNATFTESEISWVSPLLRSSVSRLDGSFVEYGNIPELAGQSVRGSCSLVTKPKF
jgi:phage host-nuclease inhibitor protein Gam